MPNHLQLDRLGFPLTDEQRLAATSARDFGAKRLAPGAASRDESHEFPAEFFAELAELGFLAMKVPLEEGGSGADNVAYVLAMEAIAEADASVAVILASSNLTSVILGQSGTAEQRERWLRPYADGRLGPASFALTEPGAGSDAGAIKTTARRDGDSYVIDGSKMWITSGAEAGLHLVFAKTDRALGTRGISAFVVEKDTPGLVVGKAERKMGLRSSGTCSLFFEGCRVPAINRIGDEGEGYRTALSALGAGRVGIAAQAIGIGEAAYAAGLRYGVDRVAFGKRVVDFQNSRFAIADCRTELDGAWLLALRAATLLDRDGAAPLESSMAKVTASEACGRVVDRMLQLHGGNGYSGDFAIERLYRDARITRIYEGTNEIQRIIMAREILKGLE